MGLPTSHTGTIQSHLHLSGERADRQGEEAESFNSQPDAGKWWLSLPISHLQAHTHTSSWLGLPTYILTRDLDTPADVFQVGSACEGPLVSEECSGGCFVQHSIKHKDVALRDSALCPLHVPVFAGFLPPTQNSASVVHAKKKK